MIRSNMSSSFTNVNCHHDFRLAQSCMFSRLCCLFLLALISSPRRVDAQPTTIRSTHGGDDVSGIYWSHSSSLASPTRFEQEESLTTFSSSLRGSLSINSMTAANQKHSQQNEDGVATHPALRQLWNGSFLSGLLANPKKNSSSNSRGGSSSASYHQGGTTTTNNASGGSSFSSSGGSGSSTNGSGEHSSSTAQSGGGSANGVQVDYYSSYDSTNNLHPDSSDGHKVWEVAVVSTLVGLALLSLVLYSTRTTSDHTTNSEAKPAPDSTKKRGIKSRIGKALSKTRCLSDDLTAHDESENSFVSLEVYLEGQQEAAADGGEIYHGNSESGGHGLGHPENGSERAANDSNPTLHEEDATSSDEIHPVDESTKTSSTKRGNFLKRIMQGYKK